MAPVLTSKETVFLDQLKPLFRNGDPQLSSALYTAVETQMRQSEGESTTADVFAAMQAVLDGYKQQMQAIATQNRADAEAAQAGIAATKTTKSIPIAGQAEIEALAVALNQTITPERVQAIADAASAADLSIAPTLQFTLDAAFSAHLVTEIHQEKSEKRVTGHGNFATSPVHGQGKLTRAFNNEKNIHGTHTSFVVRPDMFKNNQVEYDTVDMIAEAWLKKNPDIKTLPALTVVDDKGTHEFPEVTLSGRGDLRTVSLWIQRANALPRVDGKFCDATRFDNPRIFPGQELALPPGSNDLSPRQVFLKCTTCEVRTGQQDVDVAGGPRIAVTPHAAEAPPPVEPPPPPPVEPPPVEPPPPVRPPEYRPHEFFRQSSQATDGPTYRPGSMDHALLTLARSGVDANFTQEYFSLKNVVARMSVKGERASGQLGKDDFLIEGDAPFGNAQSQQDDGYAKRNSHTTGGESYISRWGNGPRGRVYFPGDAEVVTDGPDVGSYRRWDGNRLEAAKGGHYKMPLFNKFTIPIGRFFGLPVGASIGRPSSQEVFEAETRRWGISQVDAALPNVNFGGGDNMFSDVQARLTSPFETPDRVYAYMHLLNAQQTFVASMKGMDHCTDIADKQACAERALQAYRDYSENMLVSRVDAMRIPLEESNKAVRVYMQSQGVDVAAIDARLATMGHLSVVDMPQEQLEQQQSYRNKQDKRYRDITPGETNLAYSASEEYAYVTENYFELEYAKGRATEQSERQMNIEARQAFEQIIPNQQSLRAVNQFIRTNRNMQIEFGQLLHDMYRHPTNYGFSSQDEAMELLNPLLGGSEAVRDQVTKQGKTRGGAIPLPIVSMFLKDDNHHMRNPALLGAAVADNIDKNPALLAEVLDRATNLDYGTGAPRRRARRHAERDDTELSGVVTDGRRFGTAILHAYAADHSALDEGEMPAGYQNLAATLPPSAEPVVRRAVLNGAAHAERGSSGRSGNAVQFLDNRYVEEQQKAQQGDVDLNRTFDRTMGGEEAQEMGAHQIAVMGMSGHQWLLRDAITATGLRHPEFFQQLAEDIRSAKKTSIQNKYRFVARKCEKAGRAAEHYQRTGSEHAFNKSARKVKRIFEKMDTNAENDRGALVENAMDVALKFIGDDPQLSRMVLETVSNDETLRDTYLKNVPGAIMTTDGVRVTNHGRTVDKGRQFPDPNEDKLYQTQLFEAKGRGGRRKRYDVNKDELHNIVDADHDAQDDRDFSSTRRSRREDARAQRRYDEEQRALGERAHNYGNHEDPEPQRRAQRRQDQQRAQNDHAVRIQNEAMTQDDLPVQAATTASLNLPAGSNLQIVGQPDTNAAAPAQVAQAASYPAQSDHAVRIQNEAANNADASLDLPAGSNLQVVQGYTGGHAQAPQGAQHTAGGTNKSLPDGSLSPAAKAAADALGLKGLVKNNVLGTNPVVYVGSGGVDQQSVAALASWVRIMGVNKNFPEDLTPEMAATLMLENQVATLSSQDGNLVVNLDNTKVQSLVVDAATTAKLNQNTVANGTADLSMNQKIQAAQTLVSENLISVTQDPQDMVPVQESISLEATKALGQKLGEVKGVNRLGIIAAALISFIRIPGKAPVVPGEPPPPPPVTPVPCVGCNDPFVGM